MVNNDVMRLNRGRATGIGIWLLAVVLTGQALASEAAPAVVPTAVPAAHAAAQQKFQALCANCHGQWAEGTRQGPPLVDEVYVPWHHSDKTFYGAVANGVRAHHWQFGDMPAIPGVTTDEVTAMIAFIRWLQRENGIGIEDDLDETKE